MEAARRKIESVRKTSMSSLMIQSSSLVRSVPKKRLTIATVEKDKGVKTFSSKKSSYGKREARQFPVLPPFLCEAKKDAALFEQ